MKNILKFIILIVIFKLFTFCNIKNSKPNIKIINIDKENTLNISEITNNYKIIKLETIDTVLLSQIKKIEIEDNLIYVTDKVFKGVYIFNINGKIYKKFSKEGKRHNEYLSVDDFLIDKNNNTIEIFDRLNMAIFAYSLNDFELIEKIKLPFDFSYRFVKINKLYFFNTKESLNIVNNKKTKSRIIVFDKDRNKTSTLLDLKKDEKENRSIELENIFTLDKLKETYYVSFAWDNLHYRINEDKVTPFIKIDAGNRGIPNNVLKGNYDNRMEYLNSISKSKKVHRVKVLAYNDNFEIIGYGIGYPTIIDCYYINLKKNNQIFYTNNIINDYLPNFKDPLSIFKIENEYILSILYPSSIANNKIIMENLGINELDNPIIQLFKIK